jgi:hypothetical protein
MEGETVVKIDSAITEGNVNCMVVSSEIKVPEVNSERVYWENVIKEDAIRMKKIRKQLSVDLVYNQIYATELNLMGRDLMYASIKGINVEDYYKMLKKLERSCFLRTGNR